MRVAKSSGAMRISILLDLSSRPFIPLPRFIRSRNPTPLVSPSVFCLSGMCFQSCFVFILEFNRLRETLVVRPV
jgi:hypothetical protein